jgi:hypothetical protein
LALVGVIRGQDGRGLAVLQGLSGDIVRLAPGESFQGWELVDIGPRRASLRSPTGLHELALPHPAMGQARDANPASPSVHVLPGDGVPAYPAPVVKMP